MRQERQKELKKGRTIKRSPRTQEVKRYYKETSSEEEEKKKLKIKSPKGKRVPFIDIISLETYLLLPHLLTWQASLVTFPCLPPPSWLPRPVTFPVTGLLMVAGLSP